MNYFTYSIKSVSIAEQSETKLGQFPNKFINFSEPLYLEANESEEADNLFLVKCRNLI